MPNGRCRMHGGSSTGPRTADGLAKCRQAVLKHGQRTAEAIAERRSMAREYREMRDTLRATESHLKDIVAACRNRNYEFDFS